MRGDKRGASLATALVIISLLLALGLTAAGMSTSSLNVSTRAQHAQVARNLAEAAVSRALAEVLGQPAWAQNVTVHFDSAPEDAVGTLTFDRSSDGFSTNNLESDSSTPGWGGTVVPGQAVHLLGTGRCAGSQHRVEVVLFLNRFPYAVASSGPINSDGGLLVCGEDLPGGRQKRPGALASNSKVTDAVKLVGDNIEVTGDVQASGTIKLGERVAVGGEVRPGADAVKIPTLNLDVYDTASKPGVVNLSQASVYQPLTLSGYSRIDRTLQAHNGIELNNGVLYVDGDLEVTGSIKGTGAIIVTGKTSIRGAGGPSDGQLALISHGNVSIVGQPTQRQSLKGMIYTDGDLESRNLDLAGVFVANKQGPEGSHMTLDDSRLTFPSNPGNLTFPVTTAGTPATPSVRRPYLQVLLSRSSPNYDMAEFYVDPARLPRDARGQYVAPTNQQEAMAASYMLHVRSTPTGIVQVARYSDVTDPLGILTSLSATAMTGFTGTIFSSAMTEIRAQVVLLNGGLGPGTTPGTTTPGTPGGTEDWAFDLSQFMQDKDRLRVLVWRDL